MPLAMITFLDGRGNPVDPGYGQEVPVGGWGGRPDNSLPGSGYPSTRPLPPGSIGTLPVFPFDPTTPDNSLPGPQPTPTPPIQLHPGLKLVVKWVACLGFVAVPDQELPEHAQPK